MAIGEQNPGPQYRDRVTLLPPHAEAVMPSDSEKFDGPVSIFVGNGGDVSVVPVLPAGAAAITLTLSGGDFVPFLVRQVNATGTTATNLVAVW